MSMDCKPVLIKNELDERVHLVLYFLSPNDRNLKMLDIHAMSELGKIANVVPLIGKSDTLTLKEKTEIQQNVKCFNFRL